MRTSKRVPAAALAAAVASTIVFTPMAQAQAQESAGAPVAPFNYVTEHPTDPKPGFRVKPYLQKPAATTMSLNFFGEMGTTATVTLSQGGTTLSTAEVTGVNQPHLGYTDLEVAQRDEEKIKGLEGENWLRSNNNYKYSVTFSDLTPGTKYDYAVTLDGVTYKNSFTTAPSKENWDGTRIIAFSDTETEPAGRPKVHGAREWERNRTFAEGSLDRPGEGSKWFEKFGSDKRQGILEPRYPLTQDEAMLYNMDAIAKRNPDLFMVTGDLAQGSGYQPGWDEFWGYVSGEHGDLAASSPMLTAIGNWETFGALNGGYHTDGVAFGSHKGRKAYQTYFDTFGSDTPAHEDSYYRVDHGPVTIITLDSTNGQPDEDKDAEKAKAIAGNDKEFFDKKGDWGTDTNTAYTLEGIREAGNTDQPSFSNGSEQWVWAEKQLADAREQGQIIIVQFHHSPYSSGVHGTATASEHPDDQPGTPMRIYTPMFEKYGVAAVISGHDEMFERSWIDSDGDGVGFHNFDVGVAADGLRGDYRVTDEDGNVVPIEFNTYREWMAQSDEPEMWVDDENGVRQLKDGGKHYGHLEMDFEPVLCDGDITAKLTTSPVYLFPVLDSNYDLVKVERRVYDDVQEIYFKSDGTPAPRGTKCESAPTPNDKSADGSGKRDARNGSASVGSSVALGIGVLAAVLAAIGGMLSVVWFNSASLPLPQPIRDAMSQATARLNF